MYRPPEWAAGQYENQLEIKNGRRLVIDGNVVEY
jgi:hypothetical protein